MSQMEITCKTPGGLYTTLVVPYLDAADADLFHDIIGNDVMRNYYNLYVNDGVAMSEVMKPWVNNLTSREFKQVRDICYRKAYFKEYPSIDVDFENRADDEKILSMIVFRNLVSYIEGM
jgi:hypothetical protein